jgi:hypothetical protein
MTAHTLPFKRLVNRNEEMTLHELDGLGLEFRYRIHPKVRVADILPIYERSIQPDLFSFALKAHFDFTACDDDHNPLFAVEFDGRNHRLAVQKARDVRKDELCARFEFPLLRINSNHLFRRYNKQSLLRWIISAWELQKAFIAGQEKGSVPLTEDFDPIWIFHRGATLEEVHPHWISLRGRLHLQKLHKQGRMPYRTSCGFAFIDRDDNYRGIEWVDVADKQVVSVESAMRTQNFPLYLGEMFNEILFVLLYEKLIRYFKTGEGAVPTRVVEDRVKDYQSRYQNAGCHLSDTSVKTSLGLGPEGTSARSAGV